LIITKEFAERNRLAAHSKIRLRTAVGEKEFTGPRNHGVGWIDTGIRRKSGRDGYLCGPTRARGAAAVSTASIFALPKVFPLKSARLKCVWLWGRVLKSNPRRPAGSASKPCCELMQGGYRSQACSRSSWGCLSFTTHSALQFPNAGPKSVFCGRSGQPGARCSGCFLWKARLQGWRAPHWEH
jgi:hypothetical protein